MSAIIGLLGKAGCGKDTVADYLVQCHGFVKMSLADEMKRFAKKAFGFTNQQLWGPSKFRNEVDRNFDDLDRWGLAESNLEEYGCDWSYFLFGDQLGPQGYCKLLVWFDDLRADYGPTAANPNLLSPRLVLQTIGTEYGRAIDNSVWIRSTLDIAQKVLGGYHTYSREDGLYQRVTEPPRGVVIPDCRFVNEVMGVQLAGGRIIRIKRPGTQLAAVGIASHASEAEQDSILDGSCDHILIAPEGLNNLTARLDEVIPPIVRGLK